MHMAFGHLPESVMDYESIYFLRNSTGMVPLPNSIEDAEAMLPNQFEMGVLNGHSLVMLEQVITQVYMPLLSFHSHRQGGSEADQKPSVASVKPSAGVSRESTTLSEAGACHATL